MKSTLLLLILTSSIYAYDGCGTDRNEALSNLSGNIKTSVNTSFTQNTKVSGDDTVEDKISSYLNTSANLTLVNVKYTTNDKKQTCAHVEYEDQAKNTKKLLKKAFAFQDYDLPSDINEKIKKLDNWLKELDQLNYLIPVFLENIGEQQAILNKKEKLFQDLYDESIKEANSLVWRSCKSSKEDAKSALNELLFVNKGVKEEKGFWDSLTSAFSSTAPSDIDLFDTEITYIKKDSKECATIKKEDLLKVSISMNEEAKRFNKKSLDKNPIKRYDQIELYTKQFEITKKLLSLFPDTFKNNDFSNLIRAQELLAKTKETTNPQFVLFNIKSEADIKIKLDNKFVDNNKKQYVNIGEHSYTITTKDRCPISGSFSNDLKDNETISEDFDSYKYPTVIFLTSKTPTIVVDGNSFPPNKTTSIKKCSDENLIYQAKFSGQTRTGELDISANAKNTIEFKFLTAQELAVFNDAKTKEFKTTTETKFSESLTPISSKNLEFSVESGVSHGDLELHVGGSFTYVSDKDFVGVDSFTYEVTANGEDSAPRVVNITVNNSNAPIAIVPIVAKKDDNTTKEEKKEEVKEEKKETKEELTKEEKEEKYERFKKYVESQEQNMEKLEKLQKSYPDMFDRLLKEKTGI